MTPPPTLIDIDSAAAYLGMTVAWMRRRVDLKAIPHYKLGGLLRFDPEELAAFLEASRVPAVPRPR